MAVDLDASPFVRPLSLASVSCGLDSPSGSHTAASRKTSASGTTAGSGSTSTEAGGWHRGHRGHPGDVLNAAKQKAERSRGLTILQAHLRR